ncbi:MAG: diguanylate cyclase [Bacteroidetes bacterium]|nr:diguanylate cyclase [Bacteroidota bacterium]
MLSELTIPRKRQTAALNTGNAALDHERLFVAGLQQVELLARRLWNDYNVHDPGITILELLCYALTDLGYRASSSMKDILAGPGDNAAHMRSQFFTARQIFPNRALTVADYRKLLIDVVGVQNAWILPTTQTLYADTIHGQLLASPPAGSPGIVEVDLAGLYDVVVEFTDDITTTAAEDAVKVQVMERLQANRNLCEDFVSVRGVTSQRFILCCELELAPDADLVEVNAQALFQVEEYLAPPVRLYSLSEMMSRTHADGTPYTADQVFDGPLLDHGFIPDDELEASALRTEIRLSDIISIIMDIEGVRAVRDIVIAPEGSPLLKNKWVISVPEGVQALLSRDAWRIVSYKRSMPFVGDHAAVLARWNALASANAKVLRDDDLDIPLGTYRDLKSYYSFQNHFPEVYGISPAGPGGTADERHKALALQLKGYLVFFDQIMADFCAQLSHASDLFSTDPAVTRTYFHQVVDSFTGYAGMYVPSLSAMEAGIETATDDPDALIERRNRFLDHMIARFAERFQDFAHMMQSEFGATANDLIQYKCSFLADYPAISRDRSSAYNYTLRGAGDLWDSPNISGLERRIAALLGIRDSTRRNLGDIGTEPAPGNEGMYLVENILLRPEGGDPFLPICPDPNCRECFDEDPYSYRIHVILPAYDCRFSDIEFRRWAERVIREETPAHILPKICWIDQDDMTELEACYRDWIYLKSGADASNRAAKLAAFIDVLYREKNVYPAQSLHECDGADPDQKFILGQSALGTM